MIPQVINYHLMFLTCQIDKIFEGILMSFLYPGCVRLEGGSFTIRTEGQHGTDGQAGVGGRRRPPRKHIELNYVMTMSIVRIKPLCLIKGQTNLIRTQTLMKNRSNPFKGPYYGEFISLYSIIAGFVSGPNGPQERKG